MFLLSKSIPGNCLIQSHTLLPCRRGVRLRQFLLSKSIPGNCSIQSHTLLPCRRGVRLRQFLLSKSIPGNCLIQSHTLLPCRRGVRQRQFLLSKSIPGNCSIQSHTLLPCRRGGGTGIDRGGRKGGSPFRLSRAYKEAGPFSVIRPALSSAERGGFEPPVRSPVRQFSKLLV